MKHKLRLTIDVEYEASEEVSENDLVGHLDWLSFYLAGAGLYNKDLPAEVLSWEGDVEVVDPCLGCGLPCEGCVNHHYCLERLKDTK